MRAWLKIIGAIFGAIVLAVAGGFAYWGLLLPRKAPPRTQSVIPTAERLARGKYIFQVVADCDGCHSIRDFSRLADPWCPEELEKGK
jgi:hypothetical protein